MECLNCNEEMVNNLVQTKKDQIAYDICEALRGMRKPLVRCR
jgi:hypothetical protein